MSVGVNHNRRITEMAEGGRIHSGGEEGCGACSGAGISFFNCFGEVGEVAAFMMLRETAVLEAGGGEKGAANGVAEAGLGGRAGEGRGGLRQGTV